MYFYQGINSWIVNAVIKFKLRKKINDGLLANSKYENEVIVPITLRKLVFISFKKSVLYVEKTFLTSRNGLK